LKYLFVARGPGETAQARALAKYISKKGGEILFALHQEKSLHFLSKDKEFKIFLTKEPKDLERIIDKDRPEILLFFNSKMWGKYFEFCETPLFQKVPLSLGVDSNWLFNNEKYPSYKFIEWLDRYLVLFPEKIFKLGLKENGGNFSLEKETLKRIIPVDFVPAYQKPPKKKIQEIRERYKIKKGEKFIFSYFSGFGAGHKIFAFNNLILAVERLIKKGRKIKVLYIGPTENLNPKKLKKDWLLKKEVLPAEEYFLTLSSADLIFQHQGLATLTQAIAAQVPVICNVSILGEKASLKKIHFWEVLPFKRVGACEMFSKSTEISKITNEIEKLLFNKKEKEKMKENQKLIFESGEKRAFEIIKNLLKTKI